MANRTYVTDEQVEMEIAELNQSEYVQLARQEQRNKYKRRQYLYQLRSFERKGKELAEAGITMEMLKGIEAECECDE